MLIKKELLVGIVGFCTLSLIHCERPAQKSAEATHSYEIQADGLSWVKLGNLIEEVDSQQIAYTEWTSEQQYEGNFTWMIHTITLIDGSQVLLEGQFFEQDKIRPGQIQASRVNRIRLETPRYSTPEGISVGSTFGELQSLYPDSALTLMPLAMHNRVEVYVPQYSPFHYLFSLDTVSLSLSEKLTLPPEERIEAIVIM